MRLIDADAVEKITWEDPHYHDPLNVLTEVREKVRALPTVDAVPVIRCKDCIKKELCSIFRDAKQEHGFCAWAERKEE